MAIGKHELCHEDSTSRKLHTVFGVDFNRTCFDYVPRGTVVKNSGDIWTEHGSGRNVNIIPPKGFALNLAEGLPEFWVAQEYRKWETVLGPIVQDRVIPVSVSSQESD
jgi:hypothetical protein